VMATAAKIATKTNTIRISIRVNPRSFSRMPSP
jgi:hypothetical protein